MRRADRQSMGFVELMIRSSRRKAGAHCVAEECRRKKVAHDTGSLSGS